MLENNFATKSETKCTTYHFNAQNLETIDLFEFWEEIINEGDGKQKFNFQVRFCYVQNDYLTEFLGILNIKLFHYKIVLTKCIYSVKNKFSTTIIVYLQIHK